MTEPQAEERHVDLVIAIDGTILGRFAAFCVFA